MFFSSLAIVTYALHASLHPQKDQAFDLLDSVASRSEDGDTLRDRLQNLWTRLQDVKDLIVDADGNIAVAKEQGREVKGDVAKVKVVIQEARTGVRNPGT